MRSVHKSICGMGLAAMCGLGALSLGCDHREKHVTVIEQRPARAVIVERHGPVIVEHRHAPPPVVVEHRPVVVQRRPVVVHPRPRPVVVERHAAPPRSGGPAGRGPREEGRDRDSGHDRDRGR